MAYQISIIIPTLNEEYSLPLLLNALAQQKAKNFEVIIVDGTSEDKTKSAALAFIDRFPLHFYEVTKRNVAFQKNFGAEKAQGEYLFFLDADFLLFPDCTRILGEYINKTNSIVFLPHLIPDKKNFINNVMFFVTNTAIKVSQMCSIPLSAGGPLIIQKNSFLRVGRYSEHLFVGEDHDMICRTQQYAIKAKVLHEVILILSLRRQRREGNIVLLTKYAYSGLQKLVFGEVRRNSYAYEMGGHLYDKEHYA